MGSKSVLLLGALVGSAIAYFCIQNNKELFTHKQPPKAVIQTEHQKETKYQEEDIEKALATQTQQVPSKEEKTVLKDPSYLYENGEHPRLVINANSKDETDDVMAIAEKYCNEEGCVREISFSDDTAQAPWLNQAKKITAFLADNNIPNGSISIHEKDISVSGEFSDENSKLKFQSLLKPLEAKGFKIIDNTTLTQPPKTEKIEIETVEVKIPEETVQQEEVIQPEVVEETKQEPKPVISIEQSQKKINDILNTNPVYFKRNSNEISLESKNILDKIIDIVNQNTEALSLEVSGHTDASGKASYNKWLSQQRAKAVKEYLIKNNIKAKNINAVGYGEERPVMADPYDKKNRRVTIEIKEGE